MLVGVEQNPASKVINSFCTLKCHLSLDQLQFSWIVFWVLWLFCFLGSSGRTRRTTGFWPFPPPATLATLAAAAAALALPPPTFPQLLCGSCKGNTPLSLQKWQTSFPLAALDHDLSVGLSTSKKCSFYHFHLVNRETAMLSTLTLSWSFPLFGAQAVRYMMY